MGAVDNPLFPLPLGRRLIYRGTGDGEPMRVVTDVTRQHKTILGVDVVVVLDRVFVSGELAELTFDWYAQDRHGNVWYFGEDTKEFEDGKVVSTAGSFEAGKNGARAGIIMRAHPKVGLTTPQESAPGVAEDQSRVVDKNVTVTVPYGTLRHCIKTRRSSRRSSRTSWRTSGTAEASGSRASAMCGEAMSRRRSRRSFSADRVRPASAGMLPPSRRRRRC